jgi:hypothetical protein
MSEIRLYGHTTDGGAQYLCDQFVECPNGEREGVFQGSNIIVRLDGEPEVMLRGEYASASLDRRMNLATDRSG